MSLELFLAIKFLKGIKSEKSMSAMTKVCFFSILISVFALTLICAIMNGFEKATYKKLQGVNPDIIINARTNEIYFEKLKNIINKEFSKYIYNISPFSLGQIILQSHIDNKKIQMLAVLKAIDPENEPKVSNLHQMILKTYKNIKNWSKLLNGKHIFIGESLAKVLNINVGDNLDLLYPDQDLDTNNILLHAEPVIVTGIFNTGINEFDEHIVITSLDFFKNIFNYGITGINIKINKNINDQELVIKLKERFKLETSSWKDLYPAIFSALALEKIAMLSILLLITIIAFMNIISLIFMFITNKKKDIALLKSIGLSDYSIKLIFLYISLIITISSAIIAVILAWITSFIIDYYKIIKVPTDAYYVNYLPAVMDFKIAFTVLFTIIILAIIITLIPLKNTKNIEIVKILKSEYI